MNATDKFWRGTFELLKAHHNFVRAFVSGLPGAPGASQQTESLAHSCQLSYFRCMDELRPLGQALQDERGRMPGLLACVTWYLADANRFESSDLDAQRQSLMIAAQIQPELEMLLRRSHLFLHSIIELGHHCDMLLDEAKIGSLHNSEEIFAEYPKEAKEGFVLVQNVQTTLILYQFAWTRFRFAWRYASGQRIDPWSEQFFGAQPVITVWQQHMDEVMRSLD